jgi:hypothetical protein
MTYIRSSLRLQLAAGFCLSFVSATTFGSAVAAPPILHCDLKQSLTVVSADFPLVADPYVVSTVDVDGLFRFKAVVFGATGQVEYVKFYTYYQTERQAVLLHEVKYSPPPGAAASWQFGEQRVYSPELGRELIATCAWKAGQP